MNVQAEQGQQDNNCGKQQPSFVATKSGCHHSNVMQELEKGVDALLEQYKGMEEQQEEEVQSAPLAAVPARSTKRNRQTLRGMVTPFSFSPYCLFPMLCRGLLCSD